MGLMLAPIEGTPYVGGNAPGFQSVSAAGLQVLVKSNLSATSDPTASDDSGSGYRVGSRWTNTATGKVWEAVSVATLAAVWKDLTATTPPAGSGSEFQYRASATSFGAVTGSSWAGGVATLPTLAVSDLTATRIPYVGTAGRLVDNADLTWGSSTLTIDSSQLGAGSIIAAGDGARFRSLKRAYLQSIGGYSCFITPSGSGGISLSTSEIEPGTDAFVLVQGTVTTTPSFRINLALNQSADAIQVTSSGGTAGDRFSVGPTGNISAGIGSIASGTMSAAFNGANVTGWGGFAAGFQASATGTQESIAIGSYLTNAEMITTKIGGGAGSSYIWLKSSGNYLNSVSGSPLTVQANGTTVLTTSSTGGTTLTPTAISTVPLAVNLYSGQSADAIQVTSSGGTAGDRFKVAANGNTTINAASGNPLTVQRNGVASLVIDASAGVRRDYYDANNYYISTVSSSGTLTISPHTSGGGTYPANLVLNDSVSGNPGWSIGDFNTSPWIAGSAGANNVIAQKAYAYTWSMTNVGDNAMVLQIATGNLGVGVAGPSARIHAIKTTEQLRLGYDATNYFSTTVASNGDTTLAITTGTTTNGFVFSNPVSCPGSHATWPGERFGRGCVASGADSYSFGQAVVTSGDSSIGIGQSLYLLGSGTVAISYSKNYWANYSVGLGVLCEGTGDHQVLIGYRGSSLHNYSIGLGSYVTTTAANQFMIGSTTAPINSMKLITDGSGGSLNFGVTAGVLTITPSGNGLNLSDGCTFGVGSTTGTKFGTATTQKMGWWNATPIVQPAAADQVALINSTAGTYDGTLEALPDPTDSPATADALRDDLVSVLLPALRNNFTDLYTQVAAVRTALVNAGLMKGAA